MTVHRPLLSFVRKRCLQLFRRRRSFPIWWWHQKCLHISSWSPRLCCLRDNPKPNVSTLLRQLINNKVLRQKRRVLCYKCALSTERLKVGSQTAPMSGKFWDSGLRYSCSFNFSEHAFIREAKANALVELPHRAFKLNRCKLNLFKTQVRPILEYCSLICLNMRKFDRLTFENVRLAFTKRLIGGTLIIEKYA